MSVTKERADLILSVCLPGVVTFSRGVDAGTERNERLKDSCTGADGNDD